MTRTARYRAILLLAFLLPPTGFARGQAAVDEAIDQIRRLTSIGANDQRQIRNWITMQANRLTSAGPGDRPDGMNVAAFNTFRAAILAQINNEQNTPAFHTAFAEQMANVALERFEQRASSTLRRALARALLDIGRIETVPALLAGLKVEDQPARYLCGQGLVANRSAIASDNATLDRVLEVIEQVGPEERDAFVVGRLYDAIALPNALGKVLPAYLKVFDARIKRREATGSVTGTGEVPAFEFLRDVAGNLTNDQRAELVRRLAVMLRQDARRYNDPALAPPKSPSLRDRAFIERDLIERRLDAIEALLEQFVGSGRGGAIRDQLKAGGYEARASVLEEAYKWVGHADQNINGALNAAPWNVPVGAP